MTPRSAVRRASYRIFVWPAIIGLAILVGLTMGLLGEGGWDIAAWLGLASPIAACGNLMAHPKRVPHTGRLISILRRMTMRNGS